MSWYKIPDDASTLTARVNEIEADLSQQEQQTTTLTHGTQIINSDQSSPLKVFEFYGNTLTNHMGREGGFHKQGKWDADLTIGTADYKFGTSSGKIDNSAGTSMLSSTSSHEMNLNGKYVLVGFWAKGANGTPKVRNYIVGKDSNDTASTVKYQEKIIDSNWNFYYTKYDLTTNTDSYWIPQVTVVSYGTADDVVNFDGLTVYELDQATFDKIGVSLQNEDVERLFPYVDSVQHVSNPTVKVEGQQLAPTSVNEWEQGTIAANNIGSNNYYSDSTTRIRTKKDVRQRVSPNTVVTFGVHDTNYQVIMYELDEGYNRLTDVSWRQNHTITTTSNTRYVEFVISKTDDSTITPDEMLIAKPTLNIGSELKPFVPRNPSYLYAEVTLAGNENKKDISFDYLFDINYEYGKAKKKKRWETGEALTVNTDTSTLAKEPVVGTIDIVDENDGSIVTDFTVSGQTITWGSTVPTSPVAHYQLVNEEIIDNIRVQGDLSIQGDAQITVSTGNVFNEVDGELVLDETQKIGSTNLNNVVVTYNTSLKSTVNNTIVKLSDQGNQLSINLRQLIDHEARLDAGGL